jgi:glycosyltransferase involved in cell wall biosynthesis
MQIYLLAPPRYSIFLGINSVLNVLYEGLQNQQVDVKIIKPDRAGGQKNINPLEHFIDYYWRGHLQYPLPANRNAIFHIMTQTMSILLNKLPVNRAILTCHDLMQFNLKDRLTFRAKINYIIFKYQVSFMHRAAKIIAVSETTKSDICKFTNCKSQKIEVIYPGLSPSFFKSHEVDNKKIRKKFGLHGMKVILHVGNNYYYKNIEGLLWGIYYARRSVGRHLVLVKVGQDFTKGQRRLISKLGLEDTVKYFGSPPLAKLISFYKISDMLLYPSFYEGFCLPVAEGMAMGLPVIGSNKGAIPEIAKDSALFVEPDDYKQIADAITRISMDEKLAQKISASGIKNAQKFHPSIMVEKHLRIYRSFKS